MLGFLFKRRKVKKNAPSKPRRPWGEVLKELFGRIVLFTSESKEKLKDKSETNYSLGLHHLYQGNVSEALLRFRILTTFINKTHVRGNYYVARCLFLLGKDKRSQQKFQTMTLSPEVKDLVSYHLAAIDNPKGPKRIPLAIRKDYLALLFHTGMFEDSDNVRIMLRHQMAYYLTEELGKHTSKLKKRLTVLDLGCFNGEVIEAIHSLGVCDRAVGIDVYKPLLDYVLSLRVRGMALYDDVHSVDWNKYLLETDETYDLVVSAMSFSYDADILEQFKRVSRVLRGDTGYIAFTLLLTEENQERPVYDRDAEWILHVKDDVVQSLGLAGMECLSLDYRYLDLPPLVDEEGNEVEQEIDLESSVQNEYVVCIAKKGSGKEVE